MVYQFHRVVVKQQCQHVYRKHLKVKVLKLQLSLWMTSIIAINNNNKYQLPCLTICICKEEEWQDPMIFNLELILFN